MRCQGSTYLFYTLFYLGPWSLVSFLSNSHVPQAPHLSCLSVHACLDAFLAKAALVHLVHVRCALKGLRQHTSQCIQAVWAGVPSRSAVSVPELYSVDWGWTQWSARVVLFYVVVWMLVLFTQISPTCDCLITLSGFLFPREAVQNPSRTWATN